MTAAEVYELATHGGASDFALVIAACESFGPYCLIGGLAVNRYVEPVYTLDADLIVVAGNLHRLTAYLRDQGFQVEEHAYSLNAKTPGSLLRSSSARAKDIKRSWAGPWMAKSWESGPKLRAYRMLSKGNCGLTAIRSGASASAR
jgi:hypothetical protein